MIYWGIIMKKKLLFCAVFALCVSQSWGMDPAAAAEIRERHDRQNAAQRAEEQAAQEKQEARDLEERIAQAVVQLPGVVAELKDVRKSIMQIPRSDDPVRDLAQKREELVGFEAAEQAQSEVGAAAIAGDPMIAVQNIEFEKGKIVDRIKTLEKLAGLRDQERKLVDQLVVLQKVIPADQWNVDAVLLQPAGQSDQVSTEPIHLKAFREQRERQEAARQVRARRATGGAIVTALAIAITTYIGRRIYQKKKERLMRKYKLASLTPLQNNVWRAVALAHIRMPWYLQYLIKNNTGTLAGFIGSDPRAAAELYYGRVPNEAEVKAFQSRFFRNVQ
jgi:hypothetical protein